jgi:putative proteasome-type protease
MSYCLAIAVDEGLVFASDSRTNAGPDQVATYGKMHTFTVPGQRLLVLLSAGNLATTQAVVARVRRDMASADAQVSLASVLGLDEAAEYLGNLLHDQEAKHEKAVAKAGFSAEASFLIGGQIAGEAPRIFLVYPQGNYITSSEQTPFLQIGEIKYGKAILDRIIHPATTLVDAAKCALVSIDSTMRSNATVGPPVEILCYERDAFAPGRYVSLAEDDAYLLEVKRTWNQKLTEAFESVPELRWGEAPSKSRFR